MSESESENDGDRKIFDEMRTSAHKVWLAGLGVLATAEKEGTKVFNKFVERGEEVETRGRERVDEMRSDASERFNKVTNKLGDSIEEQVSKALKRLGVPTRAEIQALSEKIDALGARIEGLSQD